MAYVLITELIPMILIGDLCQCRGDLVVGPTLGHSHPSDCVSDTISLYHIVSVAAQLNQFYMGSHGLAQGMIRLKVIIDNLVH